MKKNLPINSVIIFSLFAAAAVFLMCKSNTADLFSINYKPILEYKNPADQINIDSLKQSDWFNIISKKIHDEEYRFRYDKITGHFISSNNRQNLLFTYHKNGFSVKPLITKIPLFDPTKKLINVNEKKYKSIENWGINFVLVGYGRVNEIYPFKGNDLIVNNNTATENTNELRINYKNTENGMRQDFVINHKIRGSSKLKLIVQLDTKLKFICQKDGIKFQNDKNETVMNYNKLKVLDKNGIEIEGKFQRLNNRTCEICINDKKAVYPLTIDPLSSSANWTRAGENVSDFFGYSVACVGDINNDGYSDVVVGAPLYPDIGSQNGKVYVFYGSSTGLPTTPSWAKIGTSAGYSLGASVSSAGDVNNDGYDDLIVGGLHVNVYYGSSTGLSDLPQWSMTGEHANDSYGASVSSAGDVNGDGYSDIAVGAYGFPSDSSRGKVYVYYGSASGPSSSVSWTQEGANHGDDFGFPVASAGDVNNDGFDDLIVGAPSRGQYGIVDTGKVFVYYGSSTGLSTSASWIGTGEDLSDDFGASAASAGDVNGDGYSDIIIGADYYSAHNGKAYLFDGSSTGLSNTPSWTNVGINPNDEFGSSVSNAGDVNGDGYGDIIVGAPYYSSGLSDTGKVYVYLGGASGLSNTASWSITGDQIEDVLGSSVSTAGDVNGDGYSDVIVGAPNTNSYGKVYVYYGNSSGSLPVELISFNASVINDKVRLKWTTATEINNYGFEILRKVNSINKNNNGKTYDWENIGFVKGSGNSNSPKSYTFFDSPSGGISFNYKLKQIDFNGEYKYSGIVNVLLTETNKLILMQNYPNPFNPITTIEYDLPAAAHITLDIFNSIGQKVATLVNKFEQAGNYKVVWDASKFASGIYFYKIRAKDFNEVKKLLLLK